jgi:hypothetical protein
MHSSETFFHGLPSFGCQVRYAHYTTKTPRQKWLRHILLAHPPPIFGQQIGIERVKNRIQKNLVEKTSRSAWDATAYNERFCVIAAVTTQIMQCKLASYYPAGSSVEAATTQSRHHVVGNAGTVQRDNENRKIIE